VLLITSSTPDESTTTRAELLSAIAAAGNPSRPVQVDVIVVGAGDDVSTLQDVLGSDRRNLGSRRFDVRPRSRGHSDQDAVLMGRVAVFAVLLALLTWFLHRRLVRATGIPRRWARLADTALVVLAVSTLIGVGSGEIFPTSWARPIGFLGWVWLASWLYLIPGLLVIGLFAGISRLRARRTDTTTEVDPAKRRTLQLATAAVTLAAIGTAGYGVYEASGPKISRVRVPLARLPERFNGYRIALITDLHVGPARGVDFTAKWSRS
jgi:hypothetical protein